MCCVGLIDSITTEEPGQALEVCCNEIKHRSNSQLPDDTLRTYIDGNQPIPAGLVRQFYFYANPGTQGTARLQIWRISSQAHQENGGANVEFQLAFERSVQVTPDKRNDSVTIYYDSCDRLAA